MPKKSCFWRSLTAHLTLQDALDVDAAAGVQEKRDIRSEIAKKVTPYYATVTSGKHNEKEYKALKRRSTGFSRTDRDPHPSVGLVRMERKTRVTKTLAKANAVRCHQSELLGIGVH